MHEDCLLVSGTCYRVSNRDALINALTVDPLYLQHSHSGQCFFVYRCLITLFIQTADVAAAAARLLLFEFIRSYHRLRHYCRRFTVDLVNKLFLLNKQALL